MTTERAILSEDAAIHLLLEQTKKNSSPFIKSRRHFTAEALEVKAKDAADYHSIQSVTKVYKSGASAQRNSTEWFILNCDLELPAMRERSHCVTLFVGEMNRLMIGNMSAKYRLMREANHSTKVVTKRLSSQEDFFEHFSEKIYPTYMPSFEEAGRLNSKVIFWQGTYHGNQFFEGMGRGIFSKWITFDDDFNNSNDLLVTNETLEKSKSLYYIPIDNNRCYWRLTCGFFERDEPYKITYGEIPNPANAKLIRRTTTINKTKKIYYEVYDKEGKRYPTEYQGILHVKDYESMPVRNYMISRHYHFVAMEMMPYTEKMAEWKLFRNEKHLMAVKEIMFSFMRFFLLSYHVENDADHIKLSDIIFGAQLAMTDIAKTSKQLRAHLQEHRSSVAYLALYELHDFFQENKHYVPKDKMVMESVWLGLTTAAIKKFEWLMGMIELRLSDDEVKELKQFAGMLRTWPEVSYPKVISIYEQQLMAYYAVDCENKRLALKQAAEKVNQMFDSRDSINDVSASLVVQDGPVCKKANVSK